MTRCELGSSGSGKGPLAGSCKHGNEPKGSVKCKDFLTSWANSHGGLRSM
jgi:hypothetical protein